MIKLLSVLIDERSTGLDKLYEIIDVMWELPPITDVTPELPFIYGAVVQRRIECEDEAKYMLKQRWARYWCDEDYEEMVEHPIEAPILILAGLNDDIFYANEGLMAFNSTDAPKRTIITNRGHVGCYPGPYPMEMPENPESEWIMGEIDRWFDRWLKGIQNGVEDEPSVAFYRDSDPDVYGMADEYPLPGTYRVYLYLGDGAANLNTEAPQGWFSWPDVIFNTGITGSVSVPYFNDATTLMDGKPLDLPSSIKLLEIPFTECEFATAPLEEDLTIMGPPMLELYYQSQQRFVQLVPFIYEVTPEGDEILVSRGWYEGQKLEPWSLVDTADAPVEMQAVYHHFQEGSRIKLEITTADLPMTWPYRGFDLILLHHSKDAPSRLMLPVVPDEN
ncbi:MAG: CocE/NonD family hydrolase C-terminal non-catalytic domain-containing protein [Actinomycetota bacterium]|nr:CocE/NonD family hydrolase C-terminal non-catalytic domain-containing protein [Actinomycetota bacterium]